MPLEGDVGAHQTAVRVTPWVGIILEGVLHRGGLGPGFVVADLGKLLVKVSLSLQI